MTWLKAKPGGRPNGSRVNDERASRRAAQANWRRVPDSTSGVTRDLSSKFRWLVLRSDPTCQQNEPVNQRKRRIRRCNLGVRPQPWGFSSHPKIAHLKTEKTRAPSTRECLGYARRRKALLSTRMALEISCLERWLLKCNNVMFEPCSTGPRHGQSD
jgi:hypothetical protein